MTLALVASPPAARRAAAVKISAGVGEPIDRTPRVVRAISRAAQPNPSPFSTVDRGWRHGRTARALGGKIATLEVRALLAVIARFDPFFVRTRILSTLKTHVAVCNCRSSVSIVTWRAAVQWWRSPAWPDLQWA
jgi:hypothetical protein